MNLQLVYLCMFSLSKNENMFYEKKKNKNKNKRTTKKKKVSAGESRTPDFRRVWSTRYLLRHRSKSLKIAVELIIFKTFAHEILPVDTILSR